MKSNFLYFSLLFLLTYTEASSAICYIVYGSSGIIYQSSVAPIDLSGSSHLEKLKLKLKFPGAWRLVIDNQRNCKNKNEIEKKELVVDRNKIYRCIHSGKLIKQKTPCENLYSKEQTKIDSSKDFKVSQQARENENNDLIENVESVTKISEKDAKNLADMCAHSYSERRGFKTRDRYFTEVHSFNAIDGKTIFIIMKEKNRKFELGDSFTYIYARCYETDFGKIEIDTNCSECRIERVGQ